MYDVTTQPNGDPPSCSEIIDGKLYLGNLSANLSAEYRAGLGITHIVSVCTDCSSTGPNHLVISVDDNEYEDILVHIPKAVEFIDKALQEEGGKVLVHCVMGVSRSPTIVAAYLMKTREWDVTKAVGFIKSRRPEIQPNYGFVKQLQIYAKSKCNPNPKDRSWKRRYTQDVTRYLAYVDDVGVIIKDKLCMMSEFPEDPEQGRCLLQEFMFTDVVVVGPYDVPEAVEELGLNVHNVDARQDQDAWLTLELPAICRTIARTLDGDGRVLIYSESETKAGLVVCAYLMASKHITSQAAMNTLQEALQLFTPSANFLRQLQSISGVAFKWLQPAEPEDDIEDSEGVEEAEEEGRRGEDEREEPPVPVEISPPEPQRQFLLVRPFVQLLCNVADDLGKRELVAPAGDVAERGQDVALGPGVLLSRGCALQLAGDARPAVTETDDRVQLFHTLHERIGRCTDTRRVVTLVIGERLERC
ncbi:hypothetical protein NMY22_g12580 [Coprinellus aureogranulatus]|nr:hypothetical protein NMY22_g12580 [Coprinellus aureogranulatus]